MQVTIQFVSTLGYTAVKYAEQTTGVYILTNENASPASLGEIYWGLKGILDGTFNPKPLSPRNAQFKIDILH